MTAPSVPDEEVPPPEDAQLPDQELQQGGEDESAILPALLLVMSVYLMWRGAHHQVPTGWRQVVAALSLRSLIGGALAAVAARALDDQRRNMGRAGDELWQYADAATQAGVDTGLRAIAEALLWTDRHASGDPSTKDDIAAPTDEARVPTAEQPPEELAGMVVNAVRNAAILAVGRLGLWTSKAWVTKGDSRVRDAHRTMAGQTVPIGQPFLAPGGAKLMFPGDPTAPIGLIINCRCRMDIMRR